MPIDIPILYTGRNAAVPDFKSLGKNIRESYRRIKDDVIAQQRYEDIKAERNRQQFLKETDVNRVNFANDQVQAIEMANYNDFYKVVTDILESRKGNPETADYVAVRTAANNYANEMLKYSNSEKKRLQDLDTATKKENIDKFDPEKLKEIAYWDYNTKGIYTGDELQNALRKTTEQEWIRKDTKDLGNHDYMATYVARDGFNKPIEVEEAYYGQFYNETGKTDAKGRMIYTLKEDAAVDFMAQKYTIPSRQQDLMSMMDDFDEQVSDLDKEAYINRWGEDQAAIAWYTLKNKDQLFPIATDVKQIKDTTSTKTTKKKDVDLRTGLGDLRGGRVDLTGRIDGAMDAEGNDVSILAGKNGASLTKIEYTTNPKTGNKEWMVYGQYTKPNPNEEEAFFGKKTVTEEFLVPYNEVKEPIEEEYIVKGMDAYKEPVQKKKLY